MCYVFFFYKNIFYKNIEAEICKILRIVNTNKPEAEISKRMIILSDENLKKYIFNLAVSNQIYNHQNEETCIGYSQLFIANNSSMNGTWNTYLIGTQEKKMNKLLKGNDKFFLFKLLYNSRIIKEYFQAKIGRKKGIFSLARKNNILILKKVYAFSWQFKIRRFHPLIFINVTIYTFLRYDCLASSIFWSFANFFSF